MDKKAWAEADAEIATLKARLAEEKEFSVKLAQRCAVLTSRLAALEKRDADREAWKHDAIRVLEVVLESKEARLAEADLLLLEARRHISTTRWVGGMDGREVPLPPDSAVVRLAKRIDDHLRPTVSAPAVPETQLVSYRHKNDGGSGPRFRQYKKDPLPPWAVDVRDEREEEMLRG